MTATVPARAEELRAALAPLGKLDFDALVPLRNDLEGLIAQCPTLLIVDLGGVLFLGQQAMGILVYAWRRMRAHRGQLRVVCPPGPALERLRASGLARVLSVYPDVLAAWVDPCRRG
jgi:anti-sigma B factor antagonist